MDTFFKRMAVYKLIFNFPNGEKKFSFMDTERSRNEINYTKYKFK